MTLLALDEMTDPSAWKGTLTVAQAPAGGLRFRGATGQFAERALDADVSAFRDLRLVVRADRTAEAAPFALELRANGDYQRLIPTRANADLVVPLSGFPSPLRTLRLTCLDGPLTFTVTALGALRERMLADVDDALVAKLAPVTAAIAVPGATLPAAPCLKLVNLEVRPAEQRNTGNAARTDFTGDGFVIRPPRVPYDLLYELTAFAGTRAEEAALIEHALDRLGSRSSLAVNGAELRLEQVPLPELSGDARPERVTLWFRVETSAAPSAQPTPAVPPFQRIDLEVDQRVA